MTDVSPSERAAGIRPGVPIRWQIALLVVAAQLIAIGATVVLLGFSERGLPVPSAVARDGLAPFTAIVGTIERLSPEAREPAIEAALAHEPRLKVTDEVAPLARAERWGPGRVARVALDEVLGEYAHAAVVVGRSEPDGSLFGRLGYLAAYRLPDGRWLTYAPADTTIIRTLPPAILTLVAALLTTPLVILFVWAGATLVAPLARLAEGTERFGANLDAALPTPEGPREVRVLARTIATMRRRIRELLDARTTSLAAIGHDLRTPLTRLRLRMEGIEDVRLREDMQRDADGMARMIDRGLDYLRDRRREPERRPYDLVALARTVADEAMAADGHGADGDRVTVDAPRRLVARGDPDDMRRVLENLVANALEHATQCRVGIEAHGNATTLTIEDDGPGVERASRERVLEPFERGEPARTGTGFGLGLAIARDLVASAGGTMTLGEAATGGLKVRIDLPVGPDAAHGSDPATQPPTDRTPRSAKGARNDT